MNREALDLRVLVIKYDLEKVLYDYLDGKDLLTIDERKILNDYLEDENNPLEYIRDILLEKDFEKESIKIFDLVSKKINSWYDDPNIMTELESIRSNFIESINTNNGNNKCLFLSGSACYEIKMSKNVEI